MTTMNANTNTNTDTFEKKKNKKEEKRGTRVTEFRLTRDQMARRNFLPVRVVMDDPN